MFKFGMWDAKTSRDQRKRCTRLIELMTPRSVENMNIGKCLYIVTDTNGGIINDPILTKIAEEHIICL